MSAPYDDMVRASSPGITAFFYWSYVLFGIFILLVHPQTFLGRMGS